MKTLNQMTTVLAGSVALASAMFLATPAGAAPGGTDILHFTVVKGMTNNGVEPGADGTVMASQKEQGHANNQRLQIMVSGLSTNTSYELVVAFDSDTNITDVGPFTTDAAGNANFNYTSLGNGHGGGKNATPLLTNLNPVSLIRSVDIVNTNMQSVLSADLSAPDRLQYLIKRNLSTGDVRASLFIHATTTQTQFRLMSTGLTPNADYLLAFNGEVVQTNTANADGRLNINSLVDAPPYILDVRTVELLDNTTNANVILSTELP